MRIAVTYEDGQVFQHFGHTEQFKLYDAEGGRVTSAQVVLVEGSGHGALAGFLRGKGVTHLICGGIGAGAKEAITQAAIALHNGVTGSADEAVAALLAGTLVSDPDAQCDHGHGEGEHSCGGHGHGPHRHGHQGCGGHGHAHG